MSTLAWQVRAALVDVFTTALGGTAKVIDGPAARTNIPKKFLLVGSDGGETGVGDGLTEDGVVITQELSPMGNNWRDEHGEILCSAWAWSGDTNLDRLRTDVTTIAVAAENAVRADRTLGLLKPPGFAEVSSMRIREAQVTNAALVRAVFTVSYTTLLTS